MFFAPPPPPPPPLRGREFVGVIEGLGTAVDEIIAYLAPMDFAAGHRVGYRILPAAPFYRDPLPGPVWGLDALLELRRVIPVRSIAP